MFGRLRTLFNLPGQLLLGWHLLRDPRMPLMPKVVFGGTVLLILSPLDVIDWLPVLGGAGSIAMLALVLRSFINAAPEDVRQHHMSLLGMHDS